MIPQSCSEVFHFPPCDAEITSPSDAAIARSPEMRNSRATMITTTHTATRPSRTSITSAESTITLSERDRKSTRLNSSHGYISYAVFCLKKKKERHDKRQPDNQSHVLRDTVL